MASCVNFWTNCDMSYLPSIGLAAALRLGPSWWCGPWIEPIQLAQAESCSLAVVRCAFGGGAHGNAGTAQRIAIPIARHAGGPDRIGAASGALTASTLG
jgi:hypothetical protein